MKLIIELAQPKHMPVAARVSRLGPGTRDVLLDQVFDTRRDAMAAVEATFLNVRDQYVAKRPLPVAQPLKRK